MTDQAPASDSDTDREFDDHLARYEEARSLGRPLPPWDESVLPPGLARRLRSAVAVIDLLAGLHPSRVPTARASDPGPLPVRARSPGTTRRDTGLPETEAEPGAGRAPAAPLVPGFELLNRIGAGGMGVVYRARRLSNGAVVALKILHADHAVDADRIARFWNEIRIARAMGMADSSVIVPVLDVIEGDSGPTLVMPFINGLDLESIIYERAVAPPKDEPGGPWSSGFEGENRADELSRMLLLLDQVVDAVAVVHRFNVLHRDIKPANVLVDRRGRVWLTDFGLARFRDATRITAPDQGLGTWGYMAPEQYGGADSLDFPADVFGLGATIYRALTFALPYGDGLIRPDAPRPRRPSVLAPRLPARFDAVILKALELNPRRRYQSAVEFQADWRAVREGRTVWRRSLDPVGRMTRGIGRYVVAAALLLLMILGGLALERQFRPGPGRKVRLATVPPAARLAVAPIDPDTGDPDASRIQYLNPWSDGTSTLRLEPGDYMVEAEWADGQFMDSFRHVPEPGTTEPQWFGHLRSKEGTDGAVELPRVYKPAGDITRGMALITPEDGSPPFYIDAHEVTLEQYHRVSLGNPPPSMQTMTRKPAFVVRGLDYNMALHYAELMGKRLPTLAEFRHTARVGARGRFPWGDDPAVLFRSPWTFQEVGTPAEDRTASTPPVVGLFSNVAEWTMDRKPSRMAAGDRPQGLERSAFRAVWCGAPSVMKCAPVPADFGPDALLESFEFRQNGPDGVGFRCSRSARPRFLGQPAAVVSR